MTCRFGVIDLQLNLQRLGKTFENFDQCVVVRIDDQFLDLVLLNDFKKCENFCQIVQLRRLGIWS